MRLNATEISWRTRRVSWDGFQSIEITATELRGLACGLDESWAPFVVDLRAGQVLGGRYLEADATQAQQLAD